MSKPLASFQISTSFQNLLDTVFHSIPKIVVFLLVLVIRWIVAKFPARIVDMLLAGSNSTASSSAVPPARHSRGRARDERPGGLPAGPHPFAVTPARWVPRSAALVPHEFLATLTPARHRRGEPFLHLRYVSIAQFTTLERRRLRNRHAGGRKRLPGGLSSSAPQPVLRVRRARGRGRRAGGPAVRVRQSRERPAARRRRGSRPPRPASGRARPGCRWWSTSRTTRTRRTPTATGLASRRRTAGSPRSSGRSIP